MDDLKEDQFEEEKEEIIQQSEKKKTKFWIVYEFIWNLVPYFLEIEIFAALSYTNYYRVKLQYVDKRFTGTKVAAFGLTWFAFMIQQTAYTSCKRDKKYQMYVFFIKIMLSSFFIWIGTTSLFKYWFEHKKKLPPLQSIPYVINDNMKKKRLINGITMISIGVIIWLLASLLLPYSPPLFEFLKGPDDEKVLGFI